MEWMETPEAEDFQNRLYREHLSEIVFLEERLENLKNDADAENSRIVHCEHRLRAHVAAFRIGGEKAVRTAVGLLEQDDEGEIWAEEDLYLTAMRMVGRADPETLLEKFAGSSEPLLPYFVEFLKKWDFPALNERIAALVSQESPDSALARDEEENEDDEREPALAEARAEVLRYRAPELLSPERRLKKEVRMLELRNRTEFEAEHFFPPDEEGAEHLVVAVKATYRWDERTRLSIAEKQRPVVFADEYYGEPGKSSLRYATEAVLSKPSTDIVLNGYARNLNRESFADAYLRVGSVEKTVRVFGARNWMYLGPKVVKSPASPFNKIPLTYENAYGGEDATGGDEETGAAEPRNPVGRGFAIRRGPKLDGLDLPYLEDPAALIRGWKDRPKPAGFGFVAPNWEPRAKSAGTFDEEWDKNRKPFLPEDFDRRFFNSAHPDLIAPGYLTGGEEVEMRNVHPKKERLSFRLPKIRPKISAEFMGERRVLAAALDTLVFEPEEDRFTMLWRASLHCRKKTWAVENIDVDLETEIRI